MNQTNSLMNTRNFAEHVNYTRAQKDKKSRKYTILFSLAGQHSLRLLYQKKNNLSVSLVLY